MAVGGAQLMDVLQDRPEGGTPYPAMKGCGACVSP